MVVKVDRALHNPPVRWDAYGNEYVLIEYLSEYLKLHGYRVVRATWPEREPRPLLIVADYKPEG